MFILLGVVNVSTVLISIILIGIYLFHVRRKLTANSNFKKMEPEDAKFMRTDRRPGSLDAHPTLTAIVLNYELEVQILGQNETVLYGEKQSLKKIIELPMLNSRSDCAALTKEVLSQCDLIHPSRTSELEQIIYYLKKRKSSPSNKDLEISRNGSAETETANINSLNEYIELFYEGLQEKIRASALILQLARESENLEALSKNETVLSALTRVLREDWKKSVMLCTNLIFIFFCFSTYSCFHHVIVHYKIGSLCMNIIVYELQRYEDWKLELQGAAKPSEISVIRRSTSNNVNLSETPRTGIPQKVRPKSGNFTDLNMKAVMEGSVYDLAQSTESIIDKNQLTEAERNKRYRTLIRKQEQLLRVAFFLLLNIAEDENVEEKMTKRNIVEMLSRTLERDNDELLALVLTFLKKLSIMQVNKDDMIEYGIVEKLPKMLLSNNVDVVHLTLKLLFNLSFDEDMRRKMVTLDMLPKFVNLLSDDPHQDIVLRLLYHLSYDDDVKEQFAYTDCVTLLVDMLVLNANDQVDEIMVALCINLAINRVNAEQMAVKSRLNSLMTRAITYEDALLMKMIHNIAEHRVKLENFVVFVGDLAKATMESKKEDFIIECLGVLSNLHMDDLDWAELFKHFNMLPWFNEVLRSNNAQQDFILQIIVVLGTAMHDEGCVGQLCKSNILPALIDLLKTYQEDDEIVLQILYVFKIALSHKGSIDYVIKNTEAPAYLIDLLQDNNKAIRKTCNICLDMIADQNPAWGERIKIERFRNHNAQWLQMVDSEQLEPEEEDDEDNELPPYLNTKYLSTAVVPSNDDSPSNESNVILKKSSNYDYFHKFDDNLMQGFEMESM